MKLLKDLGEGLCRILSEGDLIKYQTVHEAVSVWNLQQEELCVVVDDLEELMLRISLFLIFVLIAYICHESTDL